MNHISYADGANTFTINGKERPRVFQAVALGADNIGIYGLHDTRQQILHSVHYQQVMVNGVIYPNRDDLITVLIPILYDTGNAGGGGSGHINDKHYVHDQGTPSSVWTCNHNLGKSPAVTVKDSAGEEVEGYVKHVDNNTAILFFNGSFSGQATFN